MAANISDIERLLSAMAVSARFAGESVRRANREFGEPWEHDFAMTLHRVYGTDEMLLDAVKGYGAFVMDSMRRQKRFEKELCYPSKTFAEAAKEVYLNDEYMRRQYLPGLLLSHYLWPHHYQQITYFKNFFLPTMRVSGAGDFAEVGVGTGVYSRIALQELATAKGIGFDISPLSLGFALTHIAAFGFGERYQSRLQNVLIDPSDQKFSSIICVEVLEHLEDPVTFLRALKSMTARNGRLFVTAALNAAHADHIYLYTDPREVFAHVEESGLDLEHSFFANAYPPEGSGIPVPAALAMVLRSRD